MFCQVCYAKRLFMYSVNFAISISAFKHPQEMEITKWDAIKAFMIVPLLFNLLKMETRAIALSVWVSLLRRLFAWIQSFFEKISCHSK